MQMLETKQKTDRRCEKYRKSTPIVPQKEMGLKIERRQDGRLWGRDGEREIVLRVRHCFPWSSPGKYVSLRDDQENEIALIRDLAELDAETRLLIEQALAESCFVMDIEAILSLDEEFEIRTWQVRTKQGLRKFQTRRDEWPYVLGNGGLLIRDVAGDLFCIRNPHALDESSWKRLSPFVD